MLGIYHPVSPFPPTTIRVNGGDPPLCGRVLRSCLGVLAALAFQEQMTIVIKADNEIRDVAQCPPAEAIRDFQE